jgi:hypothetical protein
MLGSLSSQHRPSKHERRQRFSHRGVDGTSANDRQDLNADGISRIWITELACKLLKI